MNPKTRTVNFGAGVQSTAILRLIHIEKLPKPDLLVFADTQNEPTRVYDHLKFCQRIASEIGIPLRVVTEGNLAQDYIENQGREHGKKRFASMPFFTKNPDGSQGMVRRQCTRDYKLNPINREIRSFLGIPGRKRIPKGSVETWVGISTDEGHRMRDSTEVWKILRYPLIELFMSRLDCLKLIEEAGWPEPPKSACVFCPYRSNAEWRLIQKNKKDWDRAVEFDKAIRRRPGMIADQFIHRQMVPLPQVDFDPKRNKNQGSLWGEECLGMCGV